MLQSIPISVDSLLLREVTFLTVAALPTAACRDLPVPLCLSVAWFLSSRLLASPPRTHALMRACGVCVNCWGSCQVMCLRLIGAPLQEQHKCYYRIPSEWNLPAKLS